MEQIVGWQLHNKSNDQSAIQMVSAWATKNRLVLGQVKVEEKSNEITAIPELLKVLELNGCIVTIDAIGCQKEIIKLIAQQNADYVITLKKNQGNLYDEVEKLFKEAISTGFYSIEHSTYKTEEMGHGRHEIRHYVMLSGIQSRLDPFLIAWLCSWSFCFCLGVISVTLYLIYLTSLSLTLKTGRDAPPFAFELSNHCVFLLLGKQSS